MKGRTVDRFGVPVSRYGGCSPWLLGAAIVISGPCIDGRAMQNFQCQFGIKFPVIVDLPTSFTTLSLGNGRVVSPDRDGHRAGFMRSFFRTGMLRCRTHHSWCRYWRHEHQGCSRGHKDRLAACGQAVCSAHTEAGNPTGLRRSRQAVRRLFQCEFRIKYKDDESKAGLLLACS